jgi:hypothetical protein
MYVVSCFEREGLCFYIFLLGLTLETSHTSRRTTDSRLALQYVTSQQLEQLGSAGLVHDTWSPQRVRCRVPPRIVERASRLEGKNFKTSISAEVSTVEAYLDPRVHSSPCAAWCFQKIRYIITTTAQDRPPCSADSTSAGSLSSAGFSWQGSEIRDWTPHRSSLWSSGSPLCRRRYPLQS